MGNIWEESYLPNKNYRDSLCENSGVGFLNQEFLADFSGCVRRCLGLVYQQPMAIFTGKMIFYDFGGTLFQTPSRKIHNDFVGVWYPTRHACG